MKVNESYLFRFVMYCISDGVLPCSFPGRGQRRWSRPSRRGDGCDIWWYAMRICAILMRTWLEYILVETGSKHRLQFQMQHVDMILDIAVVCLLSSIPCAGSIALTTALIWTDVSPIDHNSSFCWHGPYHSVLWCFMYIVFLSFIGRCCLSRNLRIVWLSMCHSISPTQRCWTTQHNSRTSKLTCLRWLPSSHWFLCTSLKNKNILWLVTSTVHRWVWLSTYVFYIRWFGRRADGAIET